MMQTTVEPAEGTEGVTVVALDGELDASNYRELIERVRELHAAGTEKVVLDLANLSYMASSGLVALHSIALILRGVEPPDPESGWGAFHSLGLDVSTGHDDHVALVAPQPAVDRVLERTGMKHYFVVHPDRSSAIAAL